MKTLLCVILFYIITCFSTSLFAQAQRGGGISPNSGSAEGGGEVETQDETQEAQGGGGFNSPNNQSGAQTGGGFNPQGNANNADEGGGGFNPSANTSMEEDTNAAPSGGLNAGKQEANSGGGLNLGAAEEATAKKSLPWGLIIGAALLVIIGLTTFQLNRRKK